MSEIWKDIVGYEGLYQVSNTGRICSIGHYQGKWNTVYRRKDPLILRQSQDKYGYLAVVLSKNGNHKRYMVHRLVAIAFISNPDNLPMINHKDQDKRNNNVNNLEWCTARYNTNYGDNILRSSSKRRNLPSMSKPILMVYDDGKTRIFPSMNEVVRTLKISWKRIRKSAKDNTNINNSNYKFKYL